MRDVQHTNERSMVSTQWAAAAFAIATITGCINSGGTFLKDESPSTARQRNVVVLDGATVVDVRSGDLTPGVRLVLKGGKIAAIGPTWSVPIPDSAQVVDAHGQYVVPGFLDMHVHVLEQGHLWESLSLMLASGVTGFRQMSGSLVLLQQRREGTLPIRPEQPELVAMPGAFLTPWIAPDKKTAVTVVDEQAAAGADFIKIGLVTPVVLTAVLDEAHRVGIPALGHVPPDVNALDAAKAGMRSIEHLGPGDNVLMNCATDDGLKRVPIKLPPMLKLLPKIPFAEGIVTHFLRPLLVNPVLADSPRDFDQMRRIVMSYSDKKCREVAAQFAEYGEWQVPTLIKLRSSYIAEDPAYRADPALRYVDSDSLKLWRAVTQKFIDKISLDDKQTLKQIYDLDLKLVKALDDAGVKMMTGTDSGPGWVGSGLHKEFDELEKAGLTPLRVLQMTTLRGAEFLGRTATMGTVEAGKNADLVLLDGNPLESVQNLHRVYAVVRNGYYYSRQDLDALMSSVAASVESR
ncbi:amidohydrolase family protein [Solimonas terrae]|uniref:Amidohydrolase family protein n=1 Tax=Solimonas terrae TaxID=1396819 RepID=A0A6M2BUK6_9GAMM|nr:amidohydrolase family protein [Solimonas terrae]NGY05925.1 amidohydrolase family protein [Solimonas terrae]